MKAGNAEITSSSWLRARFPQDFPNKIDLGEHLRELLAEPDAYHYQIKGHEYLLNQLQQMGLLAEFKIDPTAGSTHQASTPIPNLIDL